VNKFNYLGVTITDNGEENEKIQERIAKGTNGWEDFFIIKIKEYLKKYEKKVLIRFSVVF
jgi:hypothetical protein